MYLHMGTNHLLYYIHNILEVISTKDWKARHTALLRLTWEAILYKEISSNFRIWKQLALYLRE
jgi:hypothetical protein